MTAAPDLRLLASLLRAGLSVRAALVALPAHMDEGRRGAFQRCARMTRLGASPHRAVSALHELWGPDAQSAAALLTVHEQLGGDVAATLEGLAEGIEWRERASRAAVASVAGVRLSARLVAALPLLFLPLAPSADLVTGPGLLLLTIGIGLCFAGGRWIAALLPVPPREPDHVALLASVLAAALRGGAPLATALQACCLIDGPLQEELRRAHRRVALGSSWSEALRRSRDLEALGEVLETGESLGLSLADVVEAHQRARLAEKERRFDEAVRRAPVRMVVPLTVCILPAFGLLGLGPFLRSLLGL
jgi:Flp pilus assembly protein TadB